MGVAAPRLRYGDREAWPRGFANRMFLGDLLVLANRAIHQDASDEDMLGGPYEGGGVLAAGAVTRDEADLGFLKAQRVRPIVLSALLSGALHPAALRDGTMHPLDLEWLREAAADEGRTNPLYALAEPTTGSNGDPSYIYVDREAGTGFLRALNDRSYVADFYDQPITVPGEDRPVDTQYIRLAEAVAWIATRDDALLKWAHALVALQRERMPPEVANCSALTLTSERIADHHCQCGRAICRCCADALISLFDMMRTGRLSAVGQANGAGDHVPLPTTAWENASLAPHTVALTPSVSGATAWFDVLLPRSGVLKAWPPAVAAQQGADDDELVDGNRRSVGRPNLTPAVLTRYRERLSSALTERTKKGEANAIIVGWAGAAAQPSFPTVEKALTPYHSLLRWSGRRPTEKSVNDVLALIDQALADANA